MRKTVPVLFVMEEYSVIILMHTFLLIHVKYLMWLNEITQKTCYSHWVNQHESVSYQRSCHHCSLPNDIPIRACLRWPCRYVLSWECRESQWSWIAWNMHHDTLFICILPSAARSQLVVTSHAQQWPLSRLPSSNICPSTQPPSHLPPIKRRKH